MEILGPKADPNDLTTEVGVFQDFLNKPETSIPLGSNFLVVIGDIPRGVLTFNDRVSGLYEPFGWTLNKEKQKLLQGVVQNDHICFFANGVNLPGESVNSARKGMADLYGDQAAGLLSGVVTTSRAQRDPLWITFLETNSSFIDSVLRPWVVAVSHYGLIAREKTSGYYIKTDITVMMFDKKADKKNTIRKIFTFKDCAPVSSGDMQITWGSNDTAVVQTQWVYNSYIIQTGSEARSA